MKRKIQEPNYEMLLNSTIKVENGCAIIRLNESIIAVLELNKESIVDRIDYSIYERKGWKNE